MICIFLARYNWYYQYVPTPKAEIPLAPHIPQYLLLCCIPVKNILFSVKKFQSFDNKQNTFCIHKCIHVSMS